MTKEKVKIKRYNKRLMLIILCKSKEKDEIQR